MVKQRAILELLSEVPDPEIPALSVVDLGIVRLIEPAGDSVTITITPTYSGCPAMDVIERGIRKCLADAGYSNIVIKTALTPPWTTDWMTENARQKLRDFGIAPPDGKADTDLVPMPHRLVCPFCGSKDTELRSEFSSTACKALYFCRSCVQPFEYFKSF